MDDEKPIVATRVSSRFYAGVVAAELELEDFHDKHPIVKVMMAQKRYYGGSMTKTQLLELLRYASDDAEIVFKTVVDDSQFGEFDMLHTEASLEVKPVYKTVNNAVYAKGLATLSFEAPGKVDRREKLVTTHFLAHIITLR